MSEHVADYVACVRAQGAQLGGAKGQKISAEAGTLGVRAGGAAEVSESLERKYAVSESAELEIIRACNRSTGTAVGATEIKSSPTEPTGAWKPAPAEGRPLDKIVSELQGAGTVVARSDFSMGAPRLLPEVNNSDSHARYENDRWLDERSKEAGYSLWRVGAERLGEFLLEVKVELVSATNGAGAMISWNGAPGAAVSGGMVLEMTPDGAISYWTSKEGPIVKSSRAGFRPNRRQSIAVRHKAGKIDVWCEGQEAFAGLPAGWIPGELWFGAKGRATVAFDDVVVAAVSNR